MRLHRPALVVAVLLASACNFTITGVDSHGGADAGNSTPGTTPSGTSRPGSSGTTPAPDLATPADMATTHDLFTPMADLLPLPDKVGDACADSCGGGLTCMQWVPNGYCSESCNSSNNVCPPGSSCVDIGGGSTYCLVNTNGTGKCARSDLSCRDCGASVCGSTTFCDAC